MAAYLVHLGTRDYVEGHRLPVALEENVVGPLGMMVLAAVVGVA